MNPATWVWQKQSQRRTQKQEAGHRRARPWVEWLRCGPCTCCGAASCQAGSWASAGAGAGEGQVVAVAGSACGNKPQSGRCPRSVLACLGIRQELHLQGRWDSVWPGWGPDLTHRTLPWPQPKTRVLTHHQLRPPLSGRAPPPQAPSLSSSSPSFLEPAAETAPPGA